jgi:hypothetical protein
MTKRICFRIHVVCASLWLAIGGATSRAAPLNVPPFAQITVYPGQVYDYATVQSNGVLIMSGGAIGTNSAPIASVTVLQGGWFYMNAGNIQYFDNRGVTELYGGAQSSESSENRGYVKIAGGDPGFQLLHYTGTVDVIHLATNRTSWEISSAVTSGSPTIRFFSLTNTLAAGTYTSATLPKSSTPAGHVHTNHALFWNPISNTSVRTDIQIASNWPGSVVVQVYTQLADHSVTCAIRQVSPVNVSWNSVSGRVYQIEDALSLTAQDWLAVGVPVTATGSTMSANYSGIYPAAFYRAWLRH